MLPLRVPRTAAGRRWSHAGPLLWGKRAWRSPGGGRLFSAPYSLEQTAAVGRPLFRSNGAKEGCPMSAREEHVVASVGRSGKEKAEREVIVDG
jgi:hypothetical protein